MDISKGKQYTISTKFTKRGSPAVFINPPIWTLYNSEDEELISGAAIPNGNLWEAVFTISNNYIVPGGKEDLVLQFTGFDNKNASFTTDKNLTLIDATESYKVDGVIYNILSPTATKDSIVLPTATATYTVKVFNPLGVQVGTADVHTDETATSGNSNGFTYNFNIPDLAIETNPYLNPYQIMVEYEIDGSPETEFHPLYILDMKSINLVNTLKVYLDKGKLIENDPSLQWHTTELMQAVLEGYKHINAAPPQGTFWNATTMPSVLDQHLFYASAFHALNSRYIAEGLNAFEFTGLNTQLTFNRTEVLQYKMGELQSLLAELPAIKRSAISIGGPGTPPEGETSQRLKNIAILGVTTNLLNNRINPYGRRNRFGW